MAILKSLQILRMHSFSVSIKRNKPESNKTKTESLNIKLLID